MGTPDGQSDDKQVSVSVTVQAPAERLYGMVSDITNMGKWSPETTSCAWIKGATGPAVGARFRGRNKAGWRAWSTTCRVAVAEPAKEFAFDVQTVGGINVARWSYRFEPDGNGGTKVTEVWDDHRAPFFNSLSKKVMGVPDRPGHNRAGMEKTLAALKQAAES